MDMQVKHISTLNDLEVITPEKLKFMAFNGENESVYSVYRKIKIENRFDYSDKYIFSEVINGSINKIHALKNLHNEDLVIQELIFLTETLDMFVDHCSNSSSFPKEFYNSVLFAADELTKLSEYDKALHYMNYLLLNGVDKFPELRMMTYFRIAFIYNSNGELSKAQELFSRMVEHPYLISDKSKIADLLFKLSQTTLKSGNILQYKKILFLGLRYFYTNADDRRRFFDQIRYTYKRSLLALFSDEITIYNKFLFAIHWFYFKRPNFYKIKLGAISRLVDKIFLGIVYVLNYARGGESIQTFSDVNNKTKLSLAVNNSNKNPIQPDKTKKILITRAMGGIGDLLMMTPAFHALKKRYAKHEIHLAIPKRYFPIFEGNKDVKLINIEDEFFSHITYKKWYNFTDCPAARVESRTSPRVKKSRIRIFANAIGIKHFRYLKMNKTPRYFLSDEENVFANEYLKNMQLENKSFIGVQLHSDETYRDFPLMEQLVKKISENYKVLVFDSEPIIGFNFENVIKVQSMPIRKAFAIASKCDAIVAPDSSFIHFAAAFQIPTLALFGPIDGKVRTMHYPNCKHINSKDLFGCLPCWRNESIPCKLTGMRQSVCLGNIPINKIVSELEIILKKKDLINENSK